MSTRKTGTVKFFNEEKGYGFIKNNSTNKDIFVHVTGLVGKTNLPDEGDSVEYEEENGKKGLTAVNVVILN